MLEERQIRSLKKELHCAVHSKIKKMPLERGERDWAMIEFHTLRIRLGKCEKTFYELVRQVSELEIELNTFDSQLAQLLS